MSHFVETYGWLFCYFLSVSEKGDPPPPNQEGSGQGQRPSESSNDENSRRMQEFEQLFQQRGIPPHFFSNLAPRMQQFLQQHMMPMANARSSQIIQQLNHQAKIEKFLNVKVLYN